jgi:hypothetical protein
MFKAPKNQKLKYIFIIVTQGNIKNKHDTDVNESTTLADLLVCSDDYEQLRWTAFAKYINPLKPELV